MFVQLFIRILYILRALCRRIASLLYCCRHACCMFRFVMRTKCCSDEEIKKDEMGGRCIRGFVGKPEGNHWEDLGVGGE